ncbi:MAG TPA: DUF4350 domain-containing protein [Sphingomicrobium sp.]|jgi:hypothetical protein|nr:DUF4350 domain-containing protein [Sphingomicrobium sp.]
MSDVPVQNADRSGQSAFNPRSMMLVTAIGVLAFVAMLVLGAYAPDLRSGHNGGTHALSNAATGFSGLVRLADATGRSPIIVRSEDELKDEDLVVITPDHGWTDLSKILGLRGPRATLLVLPKWETTADPANAGWVRVSGLLPATDPARALYPSAPLRIMRKRGRGEVLRTVQFGAPAELRFLAPAVVQTMSSNQLDPIITDSRGGIVLGKLKRGQLYVLADPDLVNNHGMGDERQAKAALALLDYVNSTGSTSVLFDVTTNGLGRSRSPLRLAFDAPFLAVTLTLFAAMFLAGWQALVRFGPVRRAERAIAFGKRALVDNSAALIRKAGRETHVGSRYVELIRERGIELFRLSPTLDPETLEVRLEDLNPHHSFASAAQRACTAKNRDELVEAAQLLNVWLEEIQR